MEASNRMDMWIIQNDYLTDKGVLFLYFLNRFTPRPLANVEGGTGQCSYMVMELNERQVIKIVIISRKRTHC